MSIQEEKRCFEEQRGQKVLDSAKLQFTGVEGYTVYNCSIPFRFEGKEYIFGRVEKFDEWANSHVRLFVKTGKDQFAVVEDHMIYQLEDPYVAEIQGELTMGGTHVQKVSGEIFHVFGYFFRGKDLNSLIYFTTGPQNMKDIRLVDLKDGRIGVFSRPRGEHIRAQFGSESMIGFTVIKSLEELTPDVIENAVPISGIFEKDEWGGCNQAYLLENGRIGVIGHQSFSQPAEDRETTLAVYLNVAFEFDPETFEVFNKKVIGTRCCYPACTPKLPNLADCAFTSGIVPLADGKADLYSGIGDSAEGRITIDYPFTSPMA